MRIVIDLQAAQSNSSGKRGVGRYSRDLTLALLKMQTKHEIIVALNGCYPNEVDELRREMTNYVPSRNLKIWQTPRINGSDPNAYNCRTTELIREHFLAQLKPDILHVCNLQEGFAENSPTSVNLLPSSYLISCALHDLTPLIVPDLLTDKSTIRWYLKKIRATQQCDMIYTMADITKSLIEKNLGVDSRRIVTIPGAASNIFSPALRSPSIYLKLKKDFSFKDGYLVYYGGFDLWKNVENLLLAYKKLSLEREKLPDLLMIGQMSENRRDSIVKQLDLLGIDANRVILTGRLEDAQLVCLLQHAALMVYPSFAEGFGLPVLEAMACGTPTICSNIPVLSEIRAISEATFNPSDFKDIAKLIGLVIDDVDFSSALKRKGLERCKDYSWKSSASRLLEFYESRFKERKARILGETKIRKAHLAWITGKQPSELIHKVLVKLSNVYRVTVLMDDDKPAESNLFSISNGIVLCKASTYEDVLSEFDRIILCDCEYDKWLSKHPSVVLSGSASLLNNNALRIIDPCILGEKDETLYQEIEFAFCDAASPVALVRALVDLGDNRFESVKMSEIVKSLTLNHFSVRKRRLLIDVTNSARFEPGSGIKRVVDNISKILLQEQWEHFDVSLIRLNNDNSKFLHATNYSQYLLGKKVDVEEVEVKCITGDLFLGLDLNHNLPMLQNFFQELRLAGGEFVAFIYDLLPIQHPEWFPLGMESSHKLWFDFCKKANQMICISRAVAQDVSNAIGNLKTAPNVHWIHLSGGFKRVQVSENKFPEFENTFTIMTVSVIWARKGYEYALEAFELLWSQGIDINYVIVGKEGWGVDWLIKKIKGHPELGRRLFWFNYPDDDLLVQLYMRSDGVLCPSEAEGFGLPLVEGIFYNKPIMARDISVFREIADNQVKYFVGNNAAQFANDIVDWVNMIRQGIAPQPKNVKFKEWKDTAFDLLKCIGMI